MSSVVLDPLSFKHYVPRVNDEDVEMSDDGNSIMSEQQETIQTQTGLYEILLNDKHAIFSVQPENEDYMKRVSVIMSFLSLMEIAPAKACSLIKDASQDPNSQQFRDYILFKQIFTDMQRIREVKYALAIEKSRKHTISSNKQSVIGTSTQLDNLQWMFSFFNMYSAPFHHKDTNTEDGDITLYLRERSSSGLGNVAAVVLVQKPQLEQQKELSQLVVNILQELESNVDSKTRLGVIINCNSVKLITIDADKTHQRNVTDKAVRSVSISQRDFDMCDVTDFAELVTVLEQFLATSLNICSIASQISNKKDDIIVAPHEEDADMESSPVPKSYPSFSERDCFFTDKFNTCLSYVYIPPHLAGVNATSATLDLHCVKKRSHFTKWERVVLSKLKTHPYVIRELEFDNLPLDFETTIMFENVRPLNKKMFSLHAVDNQGNSMIMTQQLINTRFEILRQFIKQALHSVIFCHNNGITHNNILSRGQTFFLDEQYKLKLMGFEHAVLSNNAQLRYRDMKHLAVVFAELMFNVQFNVSGDDDLANWSAVWEEIQACIDKHEDIVEKCPRNNANDKLLYVVNRKTKKHMFDLLKRMFHTADADYYHTYMYHSFIGMASSMYKEKSKQKLREKTIYMLNGSKNVTVVALKRAPVDKRTLTEKWTKLAGLSSNENM